MACAQASFHVPHVYRLYGSALRIPYSYCDDIGFEYLDAGIQPPPYRYYNHRSVDEVLHRTHPIRGDVGCICGSVCLHAEYQGEIPFSPLAWYCRWYCYAVVPAHIYQLPDMGEQLQRYLRIFCRYPSFHAMDADFLDNHSCRCRAVIYHTES